MERGYARPEDVDAVWRSIAPLFPALGLCKLNDFSGMDVLRDVHRNIQPTLDHRAEPGPLMDEMVEKNLLGIKSGEGFYKWTAESARDAARLRDEALIRLYRENKELEKNTGAKLGS